MPTDDPKGQARPAPFVGFQTYADDTVRDFGARGLGGEHDFEPPVWEAPPPTGPATAPELRPEPRRGAAWPTMAAAAVLIAFGGGFLLARTDPGPEPAQRPVSEAAAMAAARPMNVEVAAVAPAPPPPTARGAKLEVLTPSAEPVAPYRPRPVPPAARETPTLSIAPPPNEVAEAPVPRDAVAVAPASRQTSFDCSDAPTPARAMVCRDAGLAAMDRRMKQAYAIAIESGAPLDALAADQADWLEVREEAASYSRRAVADIYRQRIDELDAMAGRR